MQNESVVLNVGASLAGAKRVLLPRLMIASRAGSHNSILKQY